MNLRSGASFLFLAALVTACAAQSKRSADSPATGGASNEPAAYKSEEAAKGDANRPPPPPPSPQGTQPQPPSNYAQPPPNAGGTNRGMALTQAGNDIEKAQRELESSPSGDCRNACRALGSMDRAAGRLCQLADSADEKRRCDDAKNKVYTARDRVKNGCGQCDDTSVDRNAPIPSR